MMLITFGIHLYEICTKNVFLICLVYFQNCSNKKKVTMVSKHTLVQISLYPWLNGQYMLLYYSKKSFFSLNLMPKRGAKLFPPLPQFLKVGRAIAPSSFALEVVLVKFKLQTHMEHLSSSQFGFLVV